VLLDVVDLVDGGWYNALMEAFVRNVRDFADAELASLERLVGHPVDPAYRVQVILFPPPQEPDPAVVARNVIRVGHFMDKAAASARAQAVTDEEIDAAVDEAIAHVRSRSE
jgi:hypothetical protein